MLSNQGITGLTYLLDIANRDLGSFGPKILDYLSRTEKIIQNIIVPAWVTDSFGQNLNREKETKTNFKNFSISVPTRRGCQTSTSTNMSNGRNLSFDNAFNSDTNGGQKQHKEGSK